MIKQRIYLSEWDWHITVFYDTESSDADCILKELSNVGCYGYDFDRAESNLRSISLNTGLTYTNSDNRETVCVISHATSAAQFFNTLDHEKGHIANHIARYLNIDEDGEEFEYLRGEISEKTYYIAIKFLCNCK